MRKMVKKVFGTILAASLILGSLSGAVLAEKTYPDAEKWGFEEDWKMFSETTCILNDNIFYDTDSDGNRSLRIVGAAGKTNIGVYTSYKPVAEDAGITMYITGKIKTEGFKEDSSLSVYLLDGAVTANALTNSARKVVTRTYTADRDWTEIYLDQTVKFKNSGATTMYVAILLTGEGTVYADDFALVHDESMTKNPNFVATGSANVTGTYPWIRVSANRGSWGTEWAYDNGALKSTDTGKWNLLYMVAPYSNKMVSGEIYKVSIRYKDEDGNTPYVHVAYQQPTEALTSSNWNGIQNSVSLSLVEGSEDSNGFKQYVGYFTMPADKTHYGYILQGVAGVGKSEYYDDFYVEKDETSAPVAIDADADGVIEAGETVTAKMHFAEKEAKNVQMIIAVYSTSGGAKVLESVNIENYAIEASVPVDKEVSVTVPAGEGKTYTAKAFCWDADDMLTPLP